MRKANPDVGKRACTLPGPKGRGKTGGQSFAASNTIIFWKIIVPAAAPLMFTGIKMGLIYSLLGVVAFEFLTDLGGIGRLLSELNYKFKIPETMALTFATVMLSGLVLFITGWIERKLSNG